ncbi:polyprenol phosphomannose-dependent alpha 1,6 mannosyltransferase MptB [Pseudonocardia phyllosphaerae]|uniref:polyprenol phosphomannose-dependent alpha 1,6 mannosyltransferase MptB n=1 Tax=Pseudonocardia phyllosphaerae TaxID=3390502 RepID=UPI0039789EB5
MTRLRLLGGAGSLLLTGGAWALWVRPSAVALGAGVAGLGLVVLAWVLLARAAPSPGWAGRTVAVWTAPLLVAPPLFSRDAWSYLAQGALAAGGADPHRVGPAGGLPPDSAVLARVDGHWRDAPSPYGPVTDLVQRGIAAVAGDGPVAGIAAYRLLAVVAVVALGWAVVAMARRAGAPEGTALLLAAGNPLVLFHLVGGVHNDALMLAPMLCGVAVALRGADRGSRPATVLGVVLVTAGALVKIPAAAALVVLAVELGRRRGPLPAAVLVAGPAVVTGALVSAITGTSWLWSMTTPGQVGSWMAPTNWPGFAAGLADPALVEPGIALGRTAGLAAAAVAVVVVLVGQWRGRWDAVTALGLVLGAVVVAGPVVQPWYLLWAATPLLVAVPSRLRGALVGVVAVFAVLLPPLAGDLSGDVPGAITAYVVAAAAVLAVALLVRRTGYAALVRPA